jgi:hypothetical protein
MMGWADSGEDENAPANNASVVKTNSVDALITCSFDILLYSGGHE